MVPWNQGQGVVSRTGPGRVTAARQYQFRRVTVVLVIEPVVLVAGCLARPGPVPVPLSKTVTVTTPPPLRVVASGASSGRWLIYTSGPLRPGAPQVLCRAGKVSFVAPTQVAVAEGARACPARLRLTGQNGEQLVVPVTIPARPRGRLTR